MLLPPIEWSDILEIGHAEIDDDHRRLIDDVNALRQAVVDDRPWGDLVGRAKEMADHCVRHFRREEAILAREGYAGLELHVEEHRRLERSIGDIIYLMDNASPGAPLKLELLGTFRTLLVDHLLRYDLDYKSHLMFRQGR
jgi:hemerythrin-like metal-binding protein